MWCTQGLLRPILISVVIFMALMFTYSRNNECPTCVYVAQVSVNTNHTTTPEHVSWKYSTSVTVYICICPECGLRSCGHAVLWSCGLAVMRSCGLAVMWSCSHARVMPKRSESNSHVGSVVEVYWVSCFNKPIFWTMFCRHKYKNKKKTKKNKKKTGEQSTPNHGSSTPLQKQVTLYYASSWRRFDTLPVHTYIMIACYQHTQAFCISIHHTLLPYVSTWLYDHTCFILCTCNIYYWEL